ncbi:MAG: non-homologous end-joining DNA ligase [Acidobacteriaceae bacterium]|nr:non-homologous end-joining DNA ligase [Acidobacteriaceae bacterium]
MPLESDAVMMAETAAESPVRFAPFAELGNNAILAVVPAKLALAVSRLRRETGEEAREECTRFVSVLSDIRRDRISDAWSVADQRCLQTVDFGNWKPASENGSVPRTKATGHRKPRKNSSQTDEITLTIEGQQVQCTRLSKLLYPAARFTKADVIDYYVRVAPFILPHLRDRPVTLKRYPDGVTAEPYWEKDAPSFTPEWVQTFPVPRHAGGPDINYILLQNTATLAWAANAAALELHPFLHRVPDITKPTAIVFDLDPGAGADIRQCIQVALEIREVIDQLELQLFPKVSGSKGIQLYLPLNTLTSYEMTQPFARSIAQLIEKRVPKLAVSEMPKEKRIGKVFIDWSQNADYKTTVGVYSLRAKQPKPFVSMPVSWDELQRALKRGDTEALYFAPKAALPRLEDIGDLFAPVLTLQQSLPPDFAHAIEIQNRNATRTKRELREYSRKRDFSATGEPAPASPRVSAQGSRRRFVVQKHAASHLHYDFRLEIHGVLKSWAVPKGVPYDLGVRRLASATEDHPLEYLDFEGIIPRGQYGGGTVMVWDIGTYEIVEGNYWKGILHISLKGKKLKGEWILRRDRTKGGNSWVLEKTGAALKPVSAKKDDESALTGRTMAQIAGAKDATWHSNRTSIPGLDLDKLPRSEMKFVEPMLAKAVAELPEGSDWQYELKLDGYRVLAIRDGNSARLLSRRNNSLNDRFPAIVSAVEELEQGLIIDGEVVALDFAGRPSFNLLQHYNENARAIVFYVFDLIAYRGRDLRSVPLSQRRELLKALLGTAQDPLRESAVLDASAQDLIAAVQSQGLEGIVAKRSNSRYESKERSGNWVKFRVNKGQELVIGGYRPGKTYFDNLAGGYYDDSDRLIFIAKIKNGFTPELKKQIFERLHPFETKTCPFDNLPEPKNARRGEALTAEAMKNYLWVKPELVAEVGFTDWTAADHLRHSHFVALRDDKLAKEVRKETD